MAWEWGIQLIGLAGTALYFASYQCRSNRRLFQVQVASYLCYMVHLLLLGAVTGALSYAVNLVRSLCLGSRRRFAHSRGMCALLCAMQLGVLGLTWSGLPSLLPVAANIAATLAGYTHNARTIRLAGMLVNSPLLILYDVIVGSWAGILDEIASMASMLLSILRYGFSALDRQDV